MKLRYASETALAYALYGFFRLLPIDAASATGGWIGRSLGPRLRATETARDNLKAAFPEKPPEEIDAIIHGMWENLGRTAAEYAHLHRIWSRVELTGGEWLDKTREEKTPAIYCAAHLANWEINAIAAKKRGVDINLVYRKPNNTGVDGLLRHARNSGAAGHIEKGAAGAREIMSVLKKKGVLGMLVDQKLSEGIPVPFFGRDAMTAQAVAVFAMKYGCAVYPSRVERLNGCHFRMTIYPAVPVPSTGNREKDIYNMMADINQRIESWVRARPEQWLWIHRRWS